MDLQRRVSFIVLLSVASLAAICQPHEITVVETCASSTRCIEKVVPSTVSVRDAAAPKRAVDELAKGVEYGLKNRHDKAERHFRKALRIYPAYDSAYAALAESISKLGRWEEAESIIVSALERAPGHPALLRVQAAIHQHAQRYPESVPILKRVLALEPHSESALVLLARAELLTGDCRNAAAHAREAHLQQLHFNSISHIIGATCEERLGNLTEAQRHYELFLKEEPTGTTAEFARTSLARITRQTVVQNR